MQFTPQRLLTITFLSFGFWSSGVFLIRFMSSYHFWSGWPLAILFVISPPVAALCIVGVRQMLRLTSTELLPTIILLTGLVALLHGLALTIIPALYGSTTPLFTGASWLVWFCGSVMIPAVLIDHHHT